MVEVRTRELYLKNLKLEKKNEELERFAYVSSHDLQEPIRSIVGFAQLLNRKYQGQLDDQGEAYLEFITEASFRVKHLVSALLEFTRLGKKREIAAVDCNRVVNKILTTSKTLISSSAVDITVDELPTIQGCELEIGQLFQNLIHNAIKFRRKDETQAILKISVTKKKECWLFEIKDNGIGIGEEFKEKIFIIFQRLHTRDKYQGTGIGLAICKKIIELHQGKIWVESKEGSGSSFFFTLPVDK